MKLRTTYTMIDENTWEKIMKVEKEGVSGKVLYCQNILSSMLMSICNNLTCKTTNCVSIYSRMPSEACSHVSLAYIFSFKTVRALRSSEMRGERFLSSLRSFIVAF
jgi:hypothetical protein